MPFRSFLVLLTVEDQIQTLKNIRKHMKNGGFLIVDLFAPRYDLLSQSRHQAVKKIVNPQNRHVLYRKEDTMYDNALRIQARKGVRNIRQETYDYKSGEIIFIARA